jgi:hypothetical protein
LIRYIAFAVAVANLCLITVTTIDYVCWGYHWSTA